MISETWYYLGTGVILEFLHEGQQVSKAEAGCKDEKQRPSKSP